MASTFTPLGDPPPGVIPNFENPSDTLYASIEATVVLCVVLTTLFTVARLVAKRSIGPFTIEDYMMMATWLLFMGYNGLGMAQANIGLGRHIWDVKVEEAPTISQISWAIELSYCPLMFLAKATLLLQLQRTFVPRNTGSVFVVFQLLIWINFAFYFSAFLAFALECLPTERIWDPFITTGHCIDPLALLISMGVINIISDFCILVLPIWAIWHLNMKVEKKLGISAIFSMGIISFISSVGRLTYTVQGLSTEDTTYLFAKVELWSLAEIATIMFCTCFPMMPRLVKMLRERRLRGSSTHRAAYSDYSLSERRAGASSGGTIGDRRSRAKASCGTCDACVQGFECERGPFGAGFGGGGIERKIMVTVISSERGEGEEDGEALRWAAAGPAQMDVQGVGSEARAASEPEPMVL